MSQCFGTLNCECRRCLRRKRESENAIDWAKDQLRPSAEAEHDELIRLRREAVHNQIILRTADRIVKTKGGEVATVWNALASCQRIKEDNRKGLESLRTRLEKLGPYISHSATCLHHTSDDCICGLREILDATPQTQPSTPAPAPPQTCTHGSVDYCYWCNKDKAEEAKVDFYDGPPKPRDSDPDLHDPYGGHF